MSTMRYFLTSLSRMHVLDPSVVTLPGKRVSHRRLLASIHPSPLFSCSQSSGSPPHQRCNASATSLLGLEMDSTTSARFSSVSHNGTSRNPVRGRQNMMGRNCVVQELSFTMLRPRRQFLPPQYLSKGKSRKFRPCLAMKETFCIVSVRI